MQCCIAPTKISICTDLGYPPPPFSKRQPPRYYLFFNVIYPHRIKHQPLSHQSSLITITPTLYNRMDLWYTDQINTSHIRYTEMVTAWKTERVKYRSNQQGVGVNHIYSTETKGKNTNINMKMLFMKMLHFTLPSIREVMITSKINLRYQQLALLYFFLSLLQWHLELVSQKWRRRKFIVTRNPTSGSSRDAAGVNTHVCSSNTAHTTTDRAFTVLGYGWRCRQSIQFRTMGRALTTTVKHNNWVSPGQFRNGKCLGGEVSGKKKKHANIP